MKRLAVVAVLSLAASPCFAQGLGDIQPLRSFEDLPPLARDSAEAASRYGKVTGPDGRTSPGDVHTQKVLSRISEWMQALTRNAMNPAHARASGHLDAAAGQMIGQLQTTAQAMSRDQLEAHQRFAAAQAQLQRAYEADLDGVRKTFGRKMNACLSASERAGGGSCDAVRREQDAALLAAGTTYLTAYANPYEELKNKLKAVAAQGETALAKANQAFGGEPPSFAAAFVQSIVTTEMLALETVLDAESGAVVTVHDRSVAPTLHH